MESSVRAGCARWELHLTDLQSFDPDRPCPKCADDGAETRYCSEPLLVIDGTATICVETLLYYRLADSTQLYAEEHQHRMCRRCRYAWLEKVWEPPPPPPRKRRRAADEEAEE